MKPLVRMVVLAGAISAACTPAASAGPADAVPVAPPVSMNEQVLNIPGDPARPAPIVTTLLKPDGPGPFSLVVMNHGASGAARPFDEPRYRYTYSAYYFLSRGYAVVLPMMRGFSGTPGRQVLSGCNHEDVGLANAKDIAAVIDYMAAQPYIDADGVVVAGQSFGGWNTLALGSLGHPKVKGLIDAAALPYVGAGGRQGYLKFLQMPEPKAFALAADGAWSASALGNDPLAAALTACGKAHRGCRLYAVNRDVVWRVDTP